MESVAQSPQHRVQRHRVVLMMVALAAACSDSPDPVEPGEMTVERYLPLRAGATWTWKTPLEGDHTLTTTLTEVSWRDGTAYYTRESAFHPSTMVSSNGTTVLGCVPDTLHYADGSVVSTIASDEGVKSYTVLSEPLRVGASWQDAELTYEITAIVDEFPSAVGVLRDVIEVRCLYKRGPLVDAGPYYKYYAPDIGCIKHGAGSAFFTLLSYSFPD